MTTTRVLSFLVPLLTATLALAQEVQLKDGRMLYGKVTEKGNVKEIATRDGVVSVRLAGQSAPVQVGQLQLTDFVNPAGLQPLGENLLIETTASGPAQSGTPGQNGLGITTQGSVEASNVNVVEELVNMIETQRAYEMNSKAISTADQMLEYVNNQL